MNIAPEPVPLPPIPTPVTKTEPSITVLEQALANCQTGAILRYISPNFGVLRTPKHGNGKENNCIDFFRPTMYCI